MYLIWHSCWIQITVLTQSILGWISRVLSLLSFLDFFWGVEAPCYKNLYYSFHTFYCCFFLKCFQLQDVLNSQSTDLLFHSWSDCSDKGRGQNAHPIPKSWSLKRLYVCTRVAVDANAVLALLWLFFKFLKIKSWESLVFIMPYVQKWLPACVDKLGTVSLYLGLTECRLHVFQFLSLNSILYFLLLLGLIRSWRPHQQFVL